MTRTPLLLAAVLIVAPVGRAADPPKLSAADLFEDAALLQRVYEAAHPGLYRYSTKEQMDGHFAALRAEFARDRTLGEAFVAFSQFMAKVRCGHSFCNFVNQDPAVLRAVAGGTDRVPFCFRWIDGKMIVTRDLSAEKTLPPGTEVLAVGRLKTPELLARLLTVARTDGGNEAKKLAQLEVRGTGRYEAFDVFRPLFDPPAGGSIELLVRRPGADGPTAVTVAAHDHARRKALVGKPAANGDADPPWKFERLDDGSAYLRMPSWAMYNSKWDWRAFLDRGVDELVEQQVPALVVDLRGNEGGLDVGDALLARLVSAGVRRDGYRRYTRYRTLPAGLNPYLTTWDKSFRDWGRFAAEDRDGFFRMTKFDDDPAGDVIAPKGKRYAGRVVVLTDASNSSATFQFAQLAKGQQLATLVGQATGGNQRGINGGAFFFLALPRSKIEVDLPLIAGFAGHERPSGKAIPFRAIPDAGIEPDVRVVPTAADVANGVDAELRAAKELLKSK